MSLCVKSLALPVCVTFVFFCRNVSQQEVSEGLWSGLAELNHQGGGSRRKYHRHLPQQASTGVGKLLDWWGPQWVLNPKTCCFNVY